MAKQDRILTVEQALALVLERLPVPVSEKIPLNGCVGKVLAEELTAPIDQPPFDRSPLDGYALRANDSRGASKENPVTLRVAYRSLAGENADRPIGPGECIRLMTGSMIPEGADCVIRQENTDEGEAEVRIYEELSVHENFVFRGEDFCAGTPLLAAGTALDAAAVAVAASAGFDRLSVYPAPRCAIVCTGDELTEPGCALPPGKIYDANRSYLDARLTELGAEVVLAVSAGDDEAAIAQAIKDAVGKADVIITTGGVSVGVKDLIPAVLPAVGAETVFHGLAMKPGMPTLFAVLEGKPLFGLSGNPFSAIAAFELLGVPALRVLQGLTPALIRGRGVLTNEFQKASGGRRFLRARVEDGRVTLPDGHSNGQLRSMVGSNCLVDVAPGTGPLRAGDEVEFVMLA